MQYADWSTYLLQRYHRYRCFIKSPTLPGPTLPMFLKTLFPHDSTIIQVEKKNKEKKTLHLL